MINEEIKLKAKHLVNLAKGKHKIINYSDFCRTELAEELALTDDEIAYYTLIKEEE